jgi:hypothetical protein
MPGGRPFIIDRDEVKKLALEYLASDGYKTITNFCVTNKLSRRHFYNLIEQDEELLHISEQIKMRREDHLEIGGLSGDLNAGMAKFALSQLGWTEKQEVKQETMNISIDKSDADSVV